MTAFAAPLAETADTDAAAAPPPISDRDFYCWSALLRERTGIHVPPERRSFLAAGLAQRQQVCGLPSLTAYYRHLVSGAAGLLEWSQLVDQLTVQETRFFRDPASLDFVARACREMVTDGDRTVQVWSAGCATGEEAYSLALRLDAELGADARFAVTGADISFRALATARQAQYGTRRLATVPPALQARGVEMRVGERFCVAAVIRRRVCFLQMNLLAGEAVPLPAMDVIYCQNVLIYFDRADRERLVERLAARLRPGGLLVLGSGELVHCGVAALRRVSDDEVLAFRKNAPA